MKHKDFYLYQLSEVMLNTSIGTIGFLFAWLILTTFHQPEHLGVFIGISWVCHQSAFTIHSKKTLLGFCLICLLSFLALFFVQHYFIFGIILSSALYF